jgi:hypothetical protein
MLKLGTRPRSFISGNICFEFSVQCGGSKPLFKREGIIVDRKEGTIDLSLNKGGLVFTR